MHPGGMPAQTGQSMPSTHTSLHYHIVFSTKNRQPTIAHEWRARFHEYLGGSVNGLNGQSLGVGGIADHVHMLVSLNSTHCLADFMRKSVFEECEFIKGRPPVVQETIDGVFLTGTENSPEWCMPTVEDVHTIEIPGVQ